MAEQIVDGEVRIDPFSNDDYVVVEGGHLIVAGVARSNITVKPGGKLDVYGTVTGAVTNEGNVRSFKGRIDSLHDVNGGSSWGEAGSSTNEYRHEGKTLMFRDGTKAPLDEWPKKDV